MGEQEEVDFTKLSLDDRAVHKNWKARVSAYDELVKVFNRIDDEKSPEWSKWASLVRKFPIDTNAAAQEKGLEALLVFMENCASHGPKMVGDIVSSIIAKCIVSSRTKTRELAASVVLMCIEIEKYETVQEELMKGMEGKNPKQVAACVALLAQTLREFGAKVIDIKKLLKKVPVLLEDRDKTVRDETKKLVVELFKWIGPAFKSQLASLKPVLLTELETEFEKVGSEKPHVTRYLKSQQNKKEREVDNVDTVEEGDDIPDQVGPEIDPLDLIEPEDILSKLPKDFYDKCEAKKWQERKEALEALDALVTKYPKLESGDYGDLVRMLKRMIGKDSNVVVVALAAKSLAGLANGLKKKFAPYAASCIQTILEKFKEKKPAVLTALKDASDACFVATNLEQIQEDAIQALQNKNPAVKTESALFLSRCFCKVPNKTMTDKKFMKPYITALLVNITESDVGVRDAAAEAIGVCLKATGDKYMSGFIGDLDALKMQKIKEFAEKAVITAPKEKAAPKPVPSKAAAPKTSATKSADPTKKPPPAASKKPVSNTGTFVKKGVRANPSIPIIDDESSSTNLPPVIPPKAVGSPGGRIDILPQLNDGLLDKLADKNWNVRNDAVDQIIAIIVNAQHISPNLGDLPTIMCQRLQDSNRNIAANSFLLCQNLAAALGPHCKQHVRTLLSNMLSGLGDSRTNVRCTVVACLNAWADHAGLEEFFRGEIVADALKANSPLLRTELFTWLSMRLPEVRTVSKDDLGAALGLLLTCVEDRNVEVRKAAQDCVMPFMIHLGYDTMTRACGRLKPASKTAVQSLLDKARAGLPTKPPPGKAAKPGTTKTASAGTVSRNGEMTSPASKPASGLPVRGGKLPVKKIASPPARRLEENEGNNTFNLSPTGGISDDDGFYSKQEQDGAVVSGANKTFTAEDDDGPEPMDYKPTIPEPKPSISVPPYQHIQSHLPSYLRIDFKEVDNMFGGEDLKPIPDLNLYPVDVEFLTSDPPMSLPPRRSQIRSHANLLGQRGDVPAKCGQSIDMLVSTINSADFRQSIEALVHLESVVADNSIAHVREVFDTKMEALIGAVHKQIDRLLSTISSSPQEKDIDAINKNFRALSALLSAIYLPHMGLGKKVSSNCLKELIHNSLRIIADSNMSCLPDEENIVKHFNILVAQVIEKSDANAAICAVMRLLTDTVDAVDDDTSLRVLELSMKCQWKTLKQLGVWLEDPAYEFNIPAFVMEFHTFIQANPIASFNTRDATPLKTIKTMVHTLVIKLGPRDVETALSNMEIETSEAGLYLKKLIDREISKQGNEPSYRTSANTVDNFFKSLPDPTKATTEAERTEIYAARLREIQKRTGLPSNNNF